MIVECSRLGEKDKKHSVRDDDMTMNQACVLNISPV
jgi:hypothetical protein